ncbi:sulfite oxidase [Candidatus Nitrospira bockiana]
MDSNPQIDKSGLIIREAEPQNLETPVHRLRTWITPNDLFYVRTHNDTPHVDLGRWRLRVDGAVKHPLTLTLDELTRFPIVSDVVTLECSGNGRAFFTPKVEGVPWEKGAVGTARWTGVRLADVLQRAGVTEQGRHVVFDGADTRGTKPDYVRSLPIDKAMDDGTLLTFDMNGQVLPIPHGYPLRVIVPGWTGNHSVKWLTQIRVAPEPDGGHFMKEEYRFPTTYVVPGTHVPPSEMEMITSLPVKSLITGPMDGARIEAGRIRVTGVAYGGEGEILGVDVSTDLGRHWEPAALGGDKARYAWRLWTYEWEVKKPGAYVAMARARDSLNRFQPIEPFWNPDGALWNVIDRIRIEVG